MTEEQKDDWLDEEFRKNQAEEGEVTGVLNWKVAKKKSGAQKTKNKRANKKQKEEETAAAAHQEAMAGIEDPDAPAIASIPEEPSSETATSSSAPPGKKARTESWKALRNPAREAIGDGDTQALAPVDEEQIEVEEEITIEDVRNMDVEEVRTGLIDDDAPITWEEVSYADKAIVDELIALAKIHL